MKEAVGENKLPDMACINFFDNSIFIVYFSKY